MFCVIQEIQLKKPNLNGEYREYEVTSMAFTIDGEQITTYSYDPIKASGRFERPHRDAYRISLHQSYRQDGKVKKRQYSICTVSYYELVSEFWSMYDVLETGIQKAAKASGQDFGVLYDLVESKVQKLHDRIQRDFRKSDEYKAERARKKMQKDYAKRKKAFAKEYGVLESEYDHIYDIFGNLMQAEYLKKLCSERDSRRSYYEESYSNYNSRFSDDYGGYGISQSSTYTETDKTMLKEFYKSLSKKYHPDLNPDKDTTRQMQLLNRLKEGWGI